LVTVIGKCKLKGCSLLAKERDKVIVGVEINKMNDWVVKWSIGEKVYEL